MVAKATPWLWPVDRPRNPVDPAEAASESIAAPLRTPLPPSSRCRLGQISRQRGEITQTVTSAPRSDVDRLGTEPMGKSSHRPWRYFTTLLVCRSVASAGRWELRPIAGAFDVCSSKGHLVSRPTQSQSLPEARFHERDQDCHDAGRFTRSATAVPMAYVRCSPSSPSLQPTAIGCESGAVDGGAGHFAESHRSSSSLAVASD